MRSGLTAAVLLAASAGALANDGYAGLSAGGLEFRKTNDVRMVSEDLTVGPDQVRVRYVFRNESATPVASVVAFPLPAFPLDQGAMGELTPPETENLEGPDVISFATQVDGRPVPMQREIRLMHVRSVSAGDGTWTTAETDVTERLRTLGFPETFARARHQAWIGSLDAGTREALVRDGLLVMDAGENRLVPDLSMSVRYYWEQTFPPGRDVSVEHSYRPVMGGSVYYVGDELVERYCIDPPVRARLVRLQKEMDDAFARNDTPDSLPTLHFLDYILTTAATWKGPIGRFTLTLDKDHPDNILSLCLDERLEKTGPTTFRMEAENFVPVRNLEILLVSRQLQRPPSPPAP